MPKPETLLRSRIIKRLRQERPGFWTVIHGSAFQTTGLPDIIGCYKGRFIGLEVKTPQAYARAGHGLSLKQAFTLEEITRAGGIAGVISSIEQALELVPA